VNPAAGLKKRVASATSKVSIFLFLINTNMRAIEFLSESAVDELADQLPTLKRTDYDAIDTLMKRISIHHGIDGKNLHDLFVKKYGHTPDTWIKKYKNKLSEGIESSDDMAKVKDFIQWSYKTLNIQEPYPQFTFSRDTDEAQRDHRTGVHTDDGQITVYIENRNLIDIFRTIFHELVHERQDQLGMIKDGDSYPGSPIEAMADMMAGKYIKIYGKQHPEIFQ
jgi:hypothetical protein